MKFPKKPSKAELKEKYGIKNEDFQILTEMPSDAEVREKGWSVKRVADWFGIPTYLVSAAGFIYAVVMAPVVVKETSEQFASGLNWYNQNAYAPFQRLPKPSTSSGYPLFMPVGTTSSSNSVAITSSFSFPAPTPDVTDSTDPNGFHETV